MTPTTAPTDLLLHSVGMHYSAADWAGLPNDGNRYEIINGEMWASTAPSGYHQWILQLINEALREQLFRTGVGFIFFAPMGVFMPGCDPVQPDLFVVRQEDRAAFRDRHVYGVPALIVEILSPGSTSYDAQVKLAAYARAGVPEYWIVRPTERDALVHTEPEQATGQYLHVAHVRPDAVLQSPTLPFAAPVAGFFAGAPDTTL